MKLAILIINDPEYLGLKYLIEILNTKYDFKFQSQTSMAHESSEDEFLSFLGGGIEDSYEEDELQYIHQIFSSPSFYYMEFYKFSFFKEVVKFLNEYVEVMVDDDKGNIYNISTFSEKSEW